MQQILSLILFLLIFFGPIPLCLYLTTHRNPKSIVSSPIKSVLDIATFWCVIQISIGFCLGSLARFTLLPALALEMALIGLGSCLLYANPRLRANLGQHWNLAFQPKFRRSELVVLASIAFVGFVLLERLATQPFVNSDTLWFHGPIIARWYQTGSFSQLDPLGNWIIAHPHAQNYPYTWTVLSVFCLLPFQQDFLAALPIFLSWLMLGLAGFLLAIHFGATRFYALSCVALVLFAPYLINQITTLYIDLPLATVSIVSFYYLVTHQTTRSGKDAFLFWASAGIIAGIKTPGLIYTTGLVVLFGILELQAVFLKPRLSSESKLQFTGLGILLFLFLGSFWYIGLDTKMGLSALETFLPILSGMDQETLSTYASAGDLIPLPATQPTALQQTWIYINYLQSKTLTAQFDFTNGSHWSVFSKQALVRFQLPFVILVAQAILTPFAWFKCRTKSQRRKLTVLSLVFFAAFFLYWNTPFSGYNMTPLVGLNMRYGFAGFGMLGVIAAVSASTIRTNEKFITAAVVLSAISGVISSAAFDKLRAQYLMGNIISGPSKLAGNIFSNPSEGFRDLFDLLTGIGITDVAIYLVVFAILITALALSKYWLSYCPTMTPVIISNHLKGITIATFIAIALAASVHLQHVRDLNRQRVYQDIYGVIEEAVEPGERIAYFASHQSYLFYSKNLDRAVIHVWPEDGNVSNLIDELERANVKVLAVNLGELGHNDFRYSYDYDRKTVGESLTSLSAPGGPLTPIFDEGLTGQGSNRGLTLYQLNS